MKKYVVYQMVSYDQEQIIEAESPEEAVRLAQEYNEWDDPIETNYDYDIHEIKENK